MRGTLIFPADDRDFLQQLEMRGNNGGVETVETVYIIAGRTYYVPERLFACDDPSLYYAAERNVVNIDSRATAKMIQEFYEGRPGPRMILRVHTHPSGRTTPSEGDYEGAWYRRQVFDGYFDDYEFFLGIHGLGEECDPDPEWMRRPEQTKENEISWWGENRKHKLAVFEGSYQPAPVVVTTAAEWQTQQRQPLPPRRRRDPWRDRRRGGGIPDA